MSDKKTIHSKSGSEHRDVDDRPLRRRYPEVAMEGGTPFSTPDHQDMKPPTKKARLLPPYIVTPSRPAASVRLASFISVEQEIEQHRTWQNNAVENLCRYIVHENQFIHGFYVRRKNIRLWADRAGVDVDLPYLSRAARTAESVRVFTHILDLVVEIFLRPLRLRMKHLLMETNELKHITKNLWNHPMLDGYASWADGMVKEALDAGGVRQELAGLKQDYKEIARSILWMRKESYGEDIRINFLISEVRGEVTRCCRSESDGHPVVNDEVKQRVLRCIQQLYCTKRQEEQFRVSWEGPCRYFKWDPTYFYL